MTIVIGLIGICFLFLIWIMLYDSHRFEISRYTFEHASIVQGKRAVILSDLHNKQYGKENALLLEAIEREKPDFVLIAGDMITAKPGYSMEKTLKFLEKLARRYPVYYGLGNHEQRLKLYPDKYKTMKQQLFTALKDYKIEVLENRFLEVPETGILIYGLELAPRFYKRRGVPRMEKEYINGVLGVRKPDRCCVLLAHNPDYFPVYAQWGADFVISGHIHGGLVRVPFVKKGVLSPSVRFFPKYDGGLFQEKNSTLILSRGLGTHTFPIRVFNPGDLIVLDLQPGTREGNKDGD